MRDHSNFHKSIKQVVVKPAGHGCCNLCRRYVPIDDLTRIWGLKHTTAARQEVIATLCPSCYGAKLFTDACEGYLPFEAAPLAPEGFMSWDDYRREAALGRAGYIHPAARDKQ